MFINHLIFGGGPTMSRIFKLLLITVFALGLIACGGQKKAETKAPAAKTEVAKPDTTQQDTTAAKADTTQKAEEQK